MDLRQSIHNLMVENASEVLGNVLVGKPENWKPLRLHECGSYGLIDEVMSVIIDLDYKLRVKAGEVGYVLTNRDLPSETGTGNTVLDYSP